MMDGQTRGLRQIRQEYLSEGVDLMTDPYNRTEIGYGEDREAEIYYGD